MNCKQTAAALSLPLDCCLLCWLPLCVCLFLVCAQLLKENLVGQELDGKPWAPGNKTKDILIADYRCGARAAG